MLDPKIDSCREVHAKEYGTPPAVIASAPGKVSLLGDHTEFAKGISFSTALSCRLYVTVSPRSDSLIRFYSREYNERKKTALSNLKYRKEDRWANYPKGVLALFSQMGVAVDGLDIAICGDIPQGVGLGSSQALCLASAWAFNEFFQCSFTPSQLIQIAQRTEVSFLNLTTGSSAFFIQTHARENHLFWLDSRNLEWQLLGFPWPDLDLAVINSRVPSSSFDSSSTRAREDCENGLKILTGGKNGRSLRDFSKSDLRDQVGTLPESSRRRSLHIIDEIARTQEALDCFNAKDSAGLGRLMNRSHESLRDLYEVSCPEIDWLVRRLQENEGVIGARMSGEESGGCVIVLAKPDSWKKFRSQSDEYERIFGFKADLQVFRPSGGVRIHPLD